MSVKFQAPETCAKCGGSMEEGFAVDNSKVINPSHPAFGPRMKLGGSESWFRLSDPSSPKESTVSILGVGFQAQRIIADNNGIQVFTYRCRDCGFLEAYAPDLG